MKFAMVVFVVLLCKVNKSNEASDSSTGTGAEVRFARSPPFGDFQMHRTHRTTILVSDRARDSDSVDAASLLKSLNIECKSSGLANCSIKCQYKKLYLENACCRCVCRKNYASDVAGYCNRARWTSWKAWGDCVESEWGGIQTRERVCKSESREAPGSCTGRGSISRRCSSVRNKNLRVRKNLRYLTDDEMHDLIQAMTKFKKDATNRGYRKIVSWHGYPGVCPWYHHIRAHGDNHCSWHHHPLFLPWHRLIMVQIELGLQRYLKNKNLGIPYWDWTEHSFDIPYLIRHPRIYDPVEKTFVHNPFYRSFIKMQNNTKLYSHRLISYPGVLMNDFLLNGTLYAMLSHDYFNFDEYLARNPHDQIHNCFCYHTTPYCDYGMPITFFSAFDPVFIIHHSSIDRLFNMRRLLEENAGVSDWTKSRVIGEYLQKVTHEDAVANHMARAFDQPMSPFCNSSMNPETVTKNHKVWTLHYSYYNEQLFGYKYDNFDLGNGYTWKRFNHDFYRHNVLKKHWDDRIFNTKLGKITKNYCKNMQQYKTSKCVIKC